MSKEIPFYFSFTGENDFAKSKSSSSRLRLTDSPELSYIFDLLKEMSDHSESIQAWELSLTLERAMDCVLEHKNRIDNGFYLFKSVRKPSYDDNLNLKEVKKLINKRIVEAALSQVKRVGAKKPLPKGIKASDASFLSE